MLPKPCPQIAQALDDPRGVKWVVEAVVLKLSDSEKRILASLVRRSVMNETLSALLGSSSMLDKSLSII